MPDGSVAYVCTPILSSLPVFFRKKEQNFLNDINDLYSSIHHTNTPPPQRPLANLLISLKKIFSNDFKHLVKSIGFGEIERFFLNFKPSDQNSSSDLPCSDLSNSNTNSDGNPTVTGSSDLLYSVVVTLYSSDGYSNSSDGLYSVVTLYKRYTACMSSLYSVRESESI